MVGSGFYNLSKYTSMATRARAEFLIEPFVEGRPGPHVRAGIEAMAPLGPEVGPFGTTVDAPVDDLAAAIAELVRAAFANGGTRLHLLVEQANGSAHLGDLHDALGHSIRVVEQELGASLSELDRAGKQAAVRLLHDRGAFLFRGAVEELAEHIGVSRMSVYNYLRAIEDDS